MPRQHAALVLYAICGQTAVGTCGNAGDAGSAAAANAGGCPRHRQPTRDAALHTRSGRPKLYPDISSLFCNVVSGPAQLCDHVSCNVPSGCCTSPPHTSPPPSPSAHSPHGPGCCLMMISFCHFAAPQQLVRPRMAVDCSTCSLQAQRLQSLGLSQLRMTRHDSDCALQAQSSFRQRPWPCI